MKFNVQTKYCSWGKSNPAQEFAEPCEIQTVEVKEGQSFGPMGDFHKGKPFTFQTFDQTQGMAIIGFGSDLVVNGEGISKPSNNNPTLVGGKEVCFVTRTYDAGANVCLKLLGPSSR